MTRRTTLYAAFTGAGAPVLGVHDWDKRRLEALISDRVANGESFPGEHPVRITVAMYNRVLQAQGWPALEGGR